MKWNSTSWSPWLSCRRWRFCHFRSVQVRKPRPARISSWAEIWVISFSFDHHRLPISVPVIAMFPEPVEVVVKRNCADERANTKKVIWSSCQIKIAGSHLKFCNVDCRLGCESCPHSRLPWSWQCASCTLLKPAQMQFWSQSLWSWMKWARRWTLLRQSIVCSERIQAWAQISSQRCMKCHLSTQLFRPFVWFE